MSRPIKVLKGITAAEDELDDLYNYVSVLNDGVEKRVVEARIDQLLEEIKNLRMRKLLGINDE
jgi:hypothetical protein